jgi:hypothetical protein
LFNVTVETRTEAKHNISKITKYNTCAYALEAWLKFCTNVNH